MKYSLKSKQDVRLSGRKHCIAAGMLFLISASTVSFALGGDSSMPGKSTKKENPGPGEKIINRIVTEEDDGREIEIGVGEVIRVDLRFHGGSGYSWYPEPPTNDQVQLIGSRIVDLSEQGMVGGPAIGMWYFKVLAPGTTTLRMLHYRVWEGSTKATKSFSIKLRVIDKGGRK